VDTPGNLIALQVQPADVQDRDGCVPVVAAALEKLPGLKLLWVDAAYAGQTADHMRRLWGLEVTVVRRADDRRRRTWREQNAPQQRPRSHFQVLPRRWVVERSLAWLSRTRRLAKDFEALPKVSEAWVWLSGLIRLTLRLAQPP
jgi:putative transposase